MKTNHEEILPPEECLKRFLYLYDDGKVDGLVFITGDPEIHGHLKKSKVGFIEEILTSGNPERLLNIIEIANGQNALPRRSPLFFALAVAVSSASPSAVLRNKIYTAALTIARDDDEFFSFIKYVGQLKKTFSSGVNKIIAKYYTGKEPKQLVYDISSRMGYYGYTHKDLIKLSHVKNEQILHQIVMTYVLRGMEKARALADENVEAIELLDFLQKSEEVKKSSDENFVVAGLKELKFGYAQVPVGLQKSPKIWMHLVDDINISDLLKMLPHLYKNGLLKHDSICQKRIIEALTNIDRVKKSGVHPIEAFIALRNFEKGGRPKDPKLIRYLEIKSGCEQKAKANPEYKKPDFAYVEPAKCPGIVNALNKTLMYSYHNVKPTGKRYMITIDVSEEMDKPCVTTRNVTCLEAAVILTLSYLKAEKNVTVAVFNGESITPTTMEKGGSLVHAIKKLREVENGPVLAATPIEWAKAKKKPFDVFFNFIAGQIFVSELKPLSNPMLAVSKYKAAMKMSLPKIVICHLSCVHRTVYGKNVLDVRGIDANVPKIVDAFIKNFV